jgi:hypothetical protein
MGCLVGGYPNEWTTLTSATLRVRGRMFDISGSSGTLTVDFDYVPGGPLHTTESIEFTPPTTGQCGSSGWVTYERALTILDDDFSLWKSGTLFIDQRGEKDRTVQISAVEICLIGE